MRRAPLIAIAFLFVSVIYGFGFFPAVTNIGAVLRHPSSNEWEVICFTKEQQLSIPVTNSSGIFQAHSVFLATNEGVILWTAISAPSSATAVVNFAIFDPGSGAWQFGNSGPQMNAAFGSYSVGGIVTWQQKDSALPYAYRSIGASTYDPALRRWMTVQAHGIVADAIYNNAYGGAHSWLESVQPWNQTSPNWKGSFRIYDPFRQRWAGGSSPLFQSSTCAIGNNEGTVTIYRGSDRFVYGFLAEVGGWGGSITAAASFFTPSRTNGFAPMKVWFTDMSIGASNWLWSIAGTGLTNTSRTFVHTFTEPGTYLVSQRASSYWGSDTSSVAIVVRARPRLKINSSTLEITGEAPAVQILERSFDLASWSEVRTVTNVTGSFTVTNVISPSPREFFRVRQVME